MAEVAVGSGRHRAGGPDGTAAMMARYLGADVLQTFADGTVVELYANPDGAVRVDRRGTGRSVTALTLAPARVEAFLNAVAASVGATIDADHPRLEAELPALPFRGARLQGFVPPVVSAPCFVIRLPAAAVYSLAEYVAAGTLTAAQAEHLAAAAADRVTVLIVGPTGSGKTTLANAVLAEVTHRCPGDRLVILEDTVELQCAAPDHLALRTGPGVNLADLVKSTLRSAPDRIVVGEVRGVEALDLLDAWATGHPGGVGTLHAATALGALERLDRLAQRAGVPSQRHLIAEAVGVIAVLRGATGGRSRRLVELARVTGLGPDGRFILHHLTPPILSGAPA